MPLTKLDDFRAWIRSRDEGLYYIRTCTFQKTIRGEVAIDGGRFDLEEAEQIGELLLSSNPLSHLYADVAIWEKNGNLLKGVLVGVVFLLVIVIVLIRS